MVREFQIVRRAAGLATEETPAKKVWRHEFNR